MSTLQSLAQDYGIDPEFYNELSKSIQYNHMKKGKDLVSFLDELPHKQRFELAMIIH